MDGGAIAGLGKTKRHRGEALQMDTFDKQMDEAANCRGGVCRVRRTERPIGCYQMDGQRVDHVEHSGSKGESLPTSDRFVAHNVPGECPKEN